MKTRFFCAQNSVAACRPHKKTATKCLQKNWVSFGTHPILAERYRLRERYVSSWTKKPECSTFGLYPTTHGYCNCTMLSCIVASLCRCWTILGWTSWVPCFLFTFLVDINIEDCVKTSVRLFRSTPCSASFRRHANYTPTQRSPMQVCEWCAHVVQCIYRIEICLGLQRCTVTSYSIKFSVKMNNLV